jgi:hypothetical protein
MTSHRVKTKKTKSKTKNKKKIKAKKNNRKNTRKHTRKHTRKYNRKYKTYIGGTTPLLSLTPLSSGLLSPRTSVNLDEAKQLLQSYAYNRESPYSLSGKKVIPVSKLPGQGREPGLPYEQQIHSTGDRLLDKHMSISPYKSIRSASKQSKKTPAYPPPLTPPDIVLTSKGKLKTTYTPSLDIVDSGRDPYITEEGTKIPRYLMSKFKYKPRVILPLSYMPLRGNIYETLSEEERNMLDIISKYHEEYSYLSPYIYHILETLNLADQFGLILVYGKLRDELMENIRITNIKTIQSRTQLSEEDIKEFLKGIVKFSDDIYADTGPSPSMPDKEKPYEINFFKIPTPKSEPSPTSLQVVGYNNHPMYKQNLTPNDVSDLLKMSEANKNVKEKETIFILAHGKMSNELSPELKMLANKYLRVIELGKKHTLLSSKYASFYLLLNNILLNPDNAVMFQNTDAGDKKRKEIFDEICNYLLINRVSACSMKDILSLTEITHDRLFSGHYTDTDVQEDHDITMNTLYHFYSMGIFKPVDYRKKINRVPLFKKKIFELYPGTTFSTINTSFELVKTLLPIAVRENKVMNIVIFSCAVEYSNTEPYFENPNPLYKKPLEVTQSMKLLIEGKRFIFYVSMMVTSFLIAFEKDIISRYHITQVGEKYVYNKIFEYFPLGGPVKYDEITQLEDNLNKFYSNYFTTFLQETGTFNYNAIFSFAGIGQENMSYDLIEDGNPFANIPYLNEVIKVKIYLMQELYDMFNKIIDYCLAIIRDLLDVFSKYYHMYSGNLTMIDSISKDIDMIYEMSDFFTKLNEMITYIKTGFYGNNTTMPPDPPVFLSYPKYIEVKKEYDETHVKELYDEINEGMDYNRFRRDIPDSRGFTSRDYFPEPQLGFIANPVMPGEFHHIARNTYKYKEIPNVDKAKMRRKTLKATRSSLVPKPNATDSYHISV